MIQLSNQGVYLLNHETVVDETDREQLTGRLGSVPAKEEARKPVPEEGAPAPMDNVIPPAKSGPAARLRQ